MSFSNPMGFLGVGFLAFILAVAVIVLRFTDHDDKD